MELLNGGLYLKKWNNSAYLKGLSLILYREPNEDNEENERNKEIIFSTFLERMKEDYHNGGSQIRTALDKFAECYDAAKSKSSPRLCSFLYDLNRDLDPAVRVNSGSMIRVQVESVKRRKTERSGGGKRKISATIREGKENIDPQIIPTRKKKKTGKKEHNLSAHIAKNQTN